jgi:hypothetical protein
MKWIVAALSLLAASPALAGDWQVVGNTSWVGRSDVNVQVWLTAPGLTGANLAPATQMIGPFATGELRAIAAGSLANSGQNVCAHVFAYTGTGNATGVPVGTSRSIEVTDCQSFPLGSPNLSHLP